MELSTKELKLLKLICDEYKNADIADEMGYGIRYIEKLKTQLFKKTNTTSSIGLLKWAILNGRYTIKRKSTTKRLIRR
jgi:DNA-binding CsgD family transcriptional regulator